MEFDVYAVFTMRFNTNNDEEHVQTLRDDVFRMELEQA